MIIQTSEHNNHLLPLSAIMLALSCILMTGCRGSSSGGSTTTALPTIEEPDPIALAGTGLKCDTQETTTSSIASSLEVDPLVGVNAIPSYIVSKDTGNNSDLLGNAGNNLKRLYAVVPSQDPQGLPVLDPDSNLQFDVHPLLVSYAEQVTGSYALGDGSADIGDPTQIDDMFISISLDNGLTWKKEQIAKTSDKWSKAVIWGNQNIDYPGHSHKPAMAVKGNNILVAWNDKYCPNANPFNLEKINNSYPDDYFKVNGTQGSIDYAGIIAPNGKILFEVPFSCVWTARGIFREDPNTAGLYAIEWRQAEQLTSGTRDSNKITIATEDIGFALAWQEDTEGLRSGKGAGPGEGYSGSSTSKGTDIWYTYITMEDFDNVCLDGVTDCDASNEAEWTDVVADIAAFTTKPKPSHNFAYPVRVTNNEICSPDDTKPYCTDEAAKNCIATVDRSTGKSAETAKIVQRCVQYDLDYMTADSSIAPAAAVLDGDTGASRPELKILKTNADEYVSVLVYEETKGLSDSGAHDTLPTNIKLEGKSIYFESFLWDQPVSISAGRIVNLRVPEVTITKDTTTHDVISTNPTGLDIYENARRVVIASQVDVCDAGTYTFGLLYKQGYETQGGPSDMFIRMNRGFTYDDFDPVALNVSSHDTVYDTSEPPKPIAIIWTEANLQDQSYTYADDNTFSPRAFLRGEEIYIGFEFTQNWRQTSNGTRPNNFWINRYVDDGDGIKWHGPQQVSIVRGGRVSTLDPRFIPTPEGITVESNMAAADAALIESDTSNPDVLFISYGTFDMDTKEELDLYYTRSTDKGKTWEYFITTNDNGTVEVEDDTVHRAVPADYGLDGIPGTVDDTVGLAKLAHRAEAIEKEVQALASPNGTMLFSAWIQETDTACIDPWCGLESRYKLVEYDSPIVP